MDQLAQHHWSVDKSHAFLLDPARMGAYIRSFYFYKHKDAVKFVKKLSKKPDSQYFVYEIRRNEAINETFSETKKYPRYSIETEQETSWYDTRHEELDQPVGPLLDD